MAPSLTRRRPLRGISLVASGLARLNFRGRLGAWLKLMQYHAVEQPELAEPGPPLERAVGFGVAGLPTPTDTFRREFDILGFGLIR